MQSSIAQVQHIDKTKANLKHEKKVSLKNKTIDQLKKKGHKCTHIQLDAIVQETSVPTSS